MQPPVLTYCLNVHPAERLDELVALLRGPAARVRALWSPDRPRGAGLWLPLAAAAELARDEGAVERARAALDEAGLFACTANAFPIGGFHAASVKRAVYRPTWSDPARLDYTRLAARALARLLPEGEPGTLSTVPISYRAFGEDEAGLERAARHLGQLALDLRRLEEESGRPLALALEPEPLCTLETTAEAVAFVEERLLRGPGREPLRAAGLSASQAEAELRRRIGVCLDVCHLACQFETVDEALTRLAAAGVRVVKAQLSSALELTRPATNEPGRRRLAAFAEPRYLHQSIGLTAAGQRLVAEDLPDLLDGEARLAPAFEAAERVRTHFHVPLCWGGDPELGTTRAVLEDGLAALARATDHLEVETYTFSVLPPADLARYEGDVVRMVVEELRWTEAALAARGVTCA